MSFYAPLIGLHLECEFGCWVVYRNGLEGYNCGGICCVPVVGRTITGTVVVEGGCCISLVVVGIGANTDDCMLPSGTLPNGAGDGTTVTGFSVDADFFGKNL